MLMLESVIFSQHYLSVLKACIRENPQDCFFFPPHKFLQLKTQKFRQIIKASKTTVTFTYGW